ncbi:conserved oligomeric Golgi complex subunit 4 [Anticarsia gemmatalis]|uniref:conserved oligomeric Golgi complex subunit 4 n=1 Tax=Anticarsia gemmatalis TaxID=129554 RepID=UPI003F75FF5A
MSLSLLLEKYDVSTDEGLQKALNEIEKEETEVDEALSGVLSRACSLEGRLRTASQAYTKLTEVKTDAQIAADMVDKTAGLARDVSAKVRQLDLARSRVAECQRRVHDLIDLQLCSAGVEAAIKAHDYETGAGHVSRFLSMDPGSVAAARARGAPDPRDAMTRAANTLREHLVRKFEEAARKEDEASIERLFKLFPQIGRAEEGVDLLAKYLTTQTEASIRRACVVTDIGSDACVFADAVTRVVEAAGGAVERARNAHLTAQAHSLLTNTIKILQPAVCAGVRRVYNELVVARRLEADPQRTAMSPLSAEPILTELALIHSRIWLYFMFLRRKTEVDAAPSKEAEKKACMDKVEKIIADCDLMRTAQDILGHYLALERYFLEESVNKALKMATPQAGVTTSSLVDDVFFIARKVIRRAISSGSVDGACAVLNEVAAALERDVAAALRRWLRSPPHEPLALAPPRGPQAPLDAAAEFAHRLNRDVDAQRLLYLAHMNEAEAGAEWSERLATEACSASSALARSSAERDKLTSCAGGLGAAAAAFRAAHDLALAALTAAIHPRLVAWALRLVDPQPHADEMEDDADALPQALEQFTECARAQVSGRAVDTLLLAALTEIAARAEAAILHNRYDREGGLAVERRARRVSSWAGGSVPAARERCARLTQAAALLALELPAHAHDALLPTPRLAAPDAKDILARRTDFKMEDIKRLKL